MAKLLACGLLLLMLFVCPVFAQTTEFSYQGSLKDGVSLANGNYDFEFALFDALSAGNQIGATIPKNNAAVANGIFSVKLDFGSVFPGTDRFLEIRVRLTGQPGITTLAPRQLVNSAPYSVKSINTDTATNATQLGGVAASQYVTTTGGNSSYIQNATAPQPASNFNISGTGTAAVLEVTTQYNFGGNRMLRMIPDAGLTLGWGAGFANTTGVQNTFVGSYAGSANTTGSYNSFFGRSSGEDNTTGSDNSFFGQLAGLKTTTGNYNTFFGSNSGQDNTGGSNNAFFGQYSGLRNTLGVENSFVGQSAGWQNTIGTHNSFFGRNSGQGNMTGIENSFLGVNSGFFNSSGNKNSFVGVNAGDTNTVGSNNSLLGNGADVGSNNLTFASAFGSNARVDQSNSIVLGAINGVNSATADTNVGIGTTTPSNRLHISAGGANVVIGTGGCPPFAGIGFGATLSCFNYSLLGNGADTIIGRPNGGVIDFRMGNISQVSINSSGFLSILNLGAAGATTLCRNASSQIATCSSSLRYKTNIRAVGYGLDLIKKLRPITFNWKDGGTHDLGLGAEDVAIVEPLLVTYNKDGQVEGVKYDRIGVVLVNAVKEQQTVIESQQKKIETLEDQVKALTLFVCTNNKDAAICKQ